MHSQNGAAPALPIWPGALALLAMMAATRVPFAGVTWGEPDGARYLLGLEQWLRLGPRASFIYGHEMSPGFYALGATLVHWTRASPERVLDSLSLAAALVCAPLLYWLGCQLTRRAAAAVGTALFLIAPGVWWLGIEPHPQQLSLLMVIGALVCAWKGGWRWELGAALCFGAALLFKNDAVLLSLAFPALAWRKTPIWRNAAPRLWIPAAGSALFLIGRGLILGQAFGQSQQQTVHAVGSFLQIPHGTALIKQIMPIAFAAGLATLLLLAAGLAVGAARMRVWRQRWGWLLAAWVIPGVGFWMLLQGNNARHMAAFYLLPLWAAAEALIAVLGAKRLALWAAATILANLLVIPANSNTSLYPSANVPGSVRALARRTQDQRQWLEAQLGQAGASGESCILGNGTLPYFEQLLYERGDAAGYLQDLEAAAQLRTPYAAQLAWSGGIAQFVEVNDSVQFHAAAAACRHWGALPASVEFASDGLRRRFIGEEWRGLPLARRWYPAGTMVQAPRPAQ